MLFLAFSCWYEPLLSLSGRSILFLDFSLLSVLHLDFSLQSMLNLGFSFCSALSLHRSLWSTLDIEASLKSVLFRWSSVWSTMSPETFLRRDDFSMAEMNFLRCLMYCGKSSKSQWFPPFTHNGSYFSLQHSQSCLPWDQSTTSSAVPCKRQKSQRNATAQQRVNLKKNLDRMLHASNHDTFIQYNLQFHYPKKETSSAYYGGQVMHNCVSWWMALVNYQTNMHIYLIRQPLKLYTKII